MAATATLMYSAPKPRKPAGKRQTAPKRGAAPKPRARQRRKMPPLVDYLARVPDPRDPRGRRHPLPAILSLVCLAMLSGIHGYLPAAEWARSLSRRQRRRLGFRQGATPAPSTLYEVLKVLSWEALEAELRRWMTDLCVGAEADAAADTVAADAAGGHRWTALAIDGKTARGSWKRGAEVAHLLAVVQHEAGLTVAQAPVKSKQGELTALRPLLKQLVLEGMVLTFDAQFTQEDVAETILSRGGEYVMRVKQNQPTLLDQVQEVLSATNYDPARRQSVSTFEKAHGRIENRQLVVHRLEPGEVDWPGAAQVFVLIATRITNPSEPPVDTRLYGVTSLTAEEAGPEALLQLVRGHWTVENRVFWVRDVVLREDASTVATGNIVSVLASLRGAVLNLLKLTGGSRTARTIRGFNGNRTAAFQALGLSGST